MWAFHLFALAWQQRICHKCHFARDLEQGIRNILWFEFILISWTIYRTLLWCHFFFLFIFLWKIVSQHSQYKRSQRVIKLLLFGLFIFISHKLPLTFYLKFIKLFIYRIGILNLLSTIYNETLTHHQKPRHTKEYDRVM